VALIVGYRVDGGTLRLRINDPFPYDGWTGDPYLAAGGVRAAKHGAYWISYPRFRERLSWTESILVRKRDQRGATRARGSAP
jgi:hypothetical protein